MNKFKFYIVAAVLASGMTLTSCGDSFLNPDPASKGAAGAAGDPMNINSGLAAAYQILLLDSYAGGSYESSVYIGDIQSDDLWKGGGDAQDGMSGMNLNVSMFTTTGNSTLHGTWNIYTSGITRVNSALGLCETATTNNPAELKLISQYRGEGFFLRAYYLYMLWRSFGSVPFQETLYEPPYVGPQLSPDEVYAQILSDCKNAVNMLPPKSSYGDADRGRACKEAAMAMLADIYLTLAPNHRDYYNEVVTLCNNIAAMGYDLTQCNYADNFNATINNGAESLFEVQYSGSTEYDFWGGDNQASWLSTFMGPRNSGMVAGAYGWNLPTEEFVKQYEDGDLRKDITVLYQGCPAFDGMEYRRSWSNTGYNVRKFLVSKTVSPEYNTNPNNFVVYRYADVLLKKAEALNEQGHPDQAAEPLNIVRKRAGLTELPTTLTQTEMREKIIHERRMELAFEGHRWFDMIRVDNGNYALTFLKSIGKNNVTKERLLLPIPQTEMDSNHLMTQNPGY